jgi:Transcriptional regulators
VAKAAGVSRGTASNVFNNPELVRPKLRQRSKRQRANSDISGPIPKAGFCALASSTDWRHAAERLGCGRFVAEPGFRSVSPRCGPKHATRSVQTLSSSRTRTGNSGIKTALVDGFIFGRVEYLAEVEPARLRRLPFAVVDSTPARVSARSAWTRARAATRRRSI